MNVDEYVRFDAVGLADLVRRREVSPSELVDCAALRHRETAPQIHAVVEFYDDPAPSVDPGGPLAGVPVLRKDYGSTEAGRLVEMGSRLAIGRRAAETSILFRRLRDAGAVTVGRTAVPELIQHGSTESTLFGATRNPHRPDLSAGGSSGGSGAAVAAGVAPVASASDCAGSIRIPAATCGLVGLKPGRRRVPWESGGWGGIAEEFVLTRTVRDSRLFLGILGTGAYHHLGRPARIGFDTRHWANGTVDQECVAAVDAVAAMFVSLGHHVEPGAFSVSNDDLMSTWHGLFTRWVAADVAMLVESTGRRADGSTLEPLTLRSLEEAARLTAADITRAQQMQGRLTLELDERLGSHDVVLTPTLGRPEIPLGTIAGEVESMERYLELNDALFPFSYPFNVSGWPSLSVPAAVSSGGVPIGVQMSARPGHEHTLLDLAAQVEASGLYSPPASPPATGSATPVT